MPWLARVRFQRPLGMHGAFRLQVADGGVTREIDTAEFFGEHYRNNPQGGLGTFVHSETKVGRVQPANLPWLAKGDTGWTRYHGFSVEWTPTRYVFRVDGRQIWTTTVGLPDRDEFLVLSLLTTDYELSFLITWPSRAVETSVADAAKEGAAGARASSPAVRRAARRSRACVTCSPLQKGFPKVAEGWWSRARRV